MSTTIQLVKEVDGQTPSLDSDEAERRRQAHAWLDEVRWTTKQAIAACLWSALFGLGCGYAWLLLQIGGVGCQ